MIDQILAAQREATFDFREHAHPADPLAHHFEERVPYDRLMPLDPSGIAARDDHRTGGAEDERLPERPLAEHSQRLRLGAPTTGAGRSGGAAPGARVGLSSSSGRNHVAPRVVPT